MNFRWMALVCAAAVTAGAHGQDAVQWRVEDGGNGHWYQLRAREGRTWGQLNSTCIAEGGHLATMTSAAERSFLSSVMAGNSCAIGGHQLVTSPADEPAAGWRWCTGEPMTWTNWASWEPSNIDTYGAPSEEVMGCFPDGRWVDLADHLIWTQHFLIEWSADCNNDGLVDYGQILTGHLTDSNQNGVPDACEADACPGDITGNGIVNGTDLAAILAAWGSDGQSKFDCDVDNSGVVDGSDLAFVLAGWGVCP